MVVIYIFIYYHRNRIVAHDGSNHCYLNNNICYKFYVKKYIPVIIVSCHYIKEAFFIFIGNDRHKGRDHTLACFAGAVYEN